MVWNWNIPHFAQVSLWGLKGCIPEIVSSRFGPAMLETASSERAAHIVEAVAGCLRDPEVDLGNGSLFGFFGDLPSGKLT